MSKTNRTVAPFFKKLNNIHNKNAGGCLFFAYVFWLWLKRNDLPTESFEIVQYDYNGDCSRHNLRWIAGQKKHAISSAHFTWMYEGIEWDAAGEFNNRRSDCVRRVLEGLNTRYASLVERFCKVALRDRDQWNVSFDRDSAVRKLRRRFDMKIPLR